MAKEDIRDKVNTLKDMGYNVYSISRLNTYNDCQYGYYKGYILREDGSQNVYADLGSKLHDHLQNICDGVATVEDMRNSFDSDVFNTTLFMQFPSEKIQMSWEADMKAFVNDFEPLQYDKTETERGFVHNVDGVWLQGFIDVIGHNEDGTVDIVDWKTSSQFKGDKLLHAGRQLLLYKIAVEESFGLNVKRVGWYMLKYVDVHFDGKVKMCNRGSWVKDRSGVIKTQLKKMGYDNYEEMVEVAIQNNNLDNMPSEVQDRFVLEPCIVWYDITDELLQETKDYIKNTVAEIENKDQSNHRLWNCKNLYKDKGFFCKNLCGYSDTCATYKSFAEKQL